MFLLVILLMLTLLTKRNTNSNNKKICRHLLTASGYGMIISVDHPFWKKYGFPPYHFQCRTSIRAIWPSQVGKLGNMVENPTMKSLSKFKMQEGFGGNPLDRGSWWEMTDNMKKLAEKFGVMQKIKAIKAKIDKEITQNLDITNLVESAKQFEIKMALEEAKVGRLEVKKLEKKYTEEEIIDRICGDDNTDGSCSSLAFSYIANKGGYDVKDFKGGKSQDIFASPNHIRNIAELENVDGYSIRKYNDFDSAKELFSKIVDGKEYYFSCGKHAAIVRKKEKGFEYLELQDVSDKGFHPLTTSVLKERFKLQKSHTVHGIKWEALSTLIESESLYKNKDFIDLMAYINTADDSQLKGVGGGKK